MINNDIGSQLSRYFANRAAGQSGGVNDIYKRLKEKNDAIHGRGKPAAEEAAQQEKAAEETAANNRVGKGFLHKRKDRDTEKSQAKDKTDAQTAEEKLSPEERRQKEIKAILDKLNAEEAARYPTKNKGKTKTEASQSVESEITVPESGGIEGFLNDMPLFNEFKTGLMEAFKRLDSASAGSISAQYELNYTTMQYVANAAGGYDYKETSFSVKLDLNYVKAAAGGQSGKEIADAIAGSDDFESLVNNLNGIGQNQSAQAAAPGQVKPEDMLSSLQDYFSPEKTADRILDFCTSFFPISDQFKAGGDTPEAREEFAEIMRKAIQKGFDQAMGTLGAVPKATQDGIDKTHDLVFKGIDDFVKNGLNPKKQEQGIYDSLEQFFFSAQVSYSEKTVSVRGYGPQGATSTGQPAVGGQGVDTQA